MACYDCEDCKYHKNKGGKCSKWVYTCPYLAIKDEYENNNGEGCREALNTIYKNIEKSLNILDNLEWHTYYDLEDYLKYAKNSIEELMDNSLRREWEDIIKG